ncbi:cytochrome b5-like heme/steroid binding domain-containing protein [Xylariaceae sp. AK1471]|nr:cytochrome b5-like heme/steroid binding domain-containing protein [Xylariaceae sp. AK1471]
MPFLPLTDPIDDSASSVQATEALATVGGGKDAPISSTTEQVDKPPQVYVERPAVVNYETALASHKLHTAAQKDIDHQDEDPIPAKLAQSTKFTMKEVSIHNTRNDMWTVIDNEVYDVTEFQEQHPGGAKVLIGVAGKDATKKFDKYHRRALLNQYKPKLCIGVLDSGETMASSRKGLLGRLGFGAKK